MYQRSVTMWMGKNQALDVDESYQYPWNSTPLSMSEWSVWKVFVIGVKREPNMRMVMSEDALDALFRRGRQLAWKCTVVVQRAG